MNLLKQLTPRVLALALLVAPVLGATVYYGVLAAPRYVSHAVVGVKDTGAAAAGAGSVSAVTSLLLGSGNPTAVADTLYLENYIRSMGLLDKLDQRLKLREHYAHAGTDLFYRAWPSMSREAFLDYFRSRIEIRRDDLSGLLTIDVQGFDPEFAQQIARGVLADSEVFINDYSHRIARERMAFAETEALGARERLSKAKAALVDFQTEHKLLDPVAQAAAASSLTASLQAKLAAQEAELKSAQALLQDDSYQIRTLRSQIAATQAQLASERQRATAAGGDRLPALNLEYQELLGRATFAEEAHKGALLAVEQARLDATRKLKALVVIEPPTLADEAIYPQRLYNLLTVLAVAGMIYAIVRLMLATIREHQD